MKGVKRCGQSPQVIGKCGQAGLGELQVKIGEDRCGQLGDR